VACLRQDLIRLVEDPGQLVGQRARLLAQRLSHPVHLQRDVREALASAVRAHLRQSHSPIEYQVRRQTPAAGTRPTVVVVALHRYPAHGFIYVLEGSVVMQVKGGEPVTLTAGQTFYEGPDDVHIVGRNASSTTPAKLLAVLLKDKGAPAQVLVNERER
jgi:hypothetical protein